MRITRRRMDFLRKVKQLYETTNIPVHYARVAELLGVSRWSAYEMLKKLEKGGFLTSHYEVNQGEKFPGRAMVLFAPTHLLDLALSGKTIKYSLPVKEWEKVNEKLSYLHEELKKANPGELAEKLMAELAGLESPLIFSAYMLAVLTAQLQNLNQKSIELIKGMVMDATKAETALAMFAGAVIGNMLRTATQFPYLSQITGFLAKFQSQLNKLTQPEQALMMDFLDKALTRVI